MIRISMIALAASASAGALVALPRPAAAWGKFGHLMICELAYRNLTDASRDEIRRILRTGQGGITIAGRGQTPARHYYRFNQGCLEEDEIPRRNKNDHFVNLDRATAAITGDQCPADVAQGQCILSGIRRDLLILRDRSSAPPQRVFALFAIGHWLGDLHQPLHVSFGDDRGGNGINAKVTGGCGKFGYTAKELHGVWDNCILHSGTFGRVYRRADYKRTWSRFTVTYRAAGTLLANTPLSEEQRIVAGEPWQWAAESYRIALEPEVRYCVRTTAGCHYSATAPTLVRNAPERFEQLDQAYLERHDRTVEDRIRFAGFRLAHLLNQALDPAYAGPARDGLQPA